MKGKKNKSIILRVLVLCVALYFVFSLSSLWTDLVKGKENLEAIRGEISATDRKIGEYKELLSEGNETKIIEKAARERLGYVFEDEQVYIDVSAN
ncbi:MAG: septum formation initiator family protein [Acutalibacteraceae bacterium]|nr:septum formation initiator family protein [Acutalibacteraceae bacterium]